MTGYDPTPFTPEQIEKELTYVREAMEGGAFGGSFGFMYEPDRYAKEDEILAFAKEIAKYDGIVTIHPRACSVVSADYPLFTKKSHLELGLDEAVDIMEKSGCRLEYSHLIFTGARSWRPSGAPAAREERSHLTTTRSITGRRSSRWYFRSGMRHSRKRRVRSRSIK